MSLPFAVVYKGPTDLTFKGQALLINKLNMLEVTRCQWNKLK